MTIKIVRFFNFHTVDCELDRLCPMRLLNQIYVIIFEGIKIERYNNEKYVIML